MFFSTGNVDLLESSRNTTSKAKNRHINTHGKDLTRDTNATTPKPMSKMMKHLTIISQLEDKLVKVQRDIG